MNILIGTGRAILGFLYAILKLLPVKKKVIILSRQSDEPSLDIRLLAEEIKREHPDYQVVVLTKMLKGWTYIFHMLRQMYHLATSRVCVLDSYCIAVSLLNHRRSLLVIQMWHSIGTMKKFGYSVLGRGEGHSEKLARAMRMHRNYDYVLCAGRGYRDHLAQGFDIDPSKIVIYPLPRVQVLQDTGCAAERRKAIFAEYPQLADEKKMNLVYVPTFRKTGVGEAEFREACRELFYRIDYSKYNLVFKPHPVMPFDPNDDRVIYDTKFSSMDMLFIADAVITDYSCIMYEAAVLDKPLYFYDFDYEEYMQDRDIYMNYRKEVPGPICFSADHLISEIGKNSADHERLKTFLNKYVEVTGHETENIVHFIWDHMK